MTKTVVGVFNSATDAQNAVDKLMSAGFVKSNVDVAAQDARIAQQQMGTAGQPAPGTPGSNNDPSDFRNSSGTMAEGAADATSRAAGEAEDGISRFFNNLFGSDDDESRTAYTNVTRQGGSVVTVHASTTNEAEKARDIMDDYNAVDVHEQHQQYAMSGAQYSDRQATTGQAAASGQAEQKLNIVEEKLQVGKRVEQTGGARIRTRIIEKPVEEHVRLRQEHVTVQRHAVDRPATEADFNTFKEGEIKVTESAERAVVAKEARVVGEVTVDKNVTAEDKTIRDTVRKTDVQVEKLDADNAGRAKK